MKAAGHTNVFLIHQVPGSKGDEVPCERLQTSNMTSHVILLVFIIVQA